MVGKSGILADEVGRVTSEGKYGDNYEEGRSQVPVVVAMEYPFFDIVSSVHFGAVICKQILGQLGMLSR